MRLAGKADHYALIQNRRLERAKEREKTFIPSSVLQKVRLASHRPPRPAEHTHTLPSHKQRYIDLVISLIGNR